MSPDAQMVLNVSETQSQELLTSFACLILHDDNAEISESNINTLIKAAGAKVEPYWPKLFAELLAGKDVGELLMNACSSGGAPAAGGAPAGEAAAGEAAPEAEAESEESSSSGGEGGMGGGLFGSDSESD